MSPTPKSKTKKIRRALAVDGVLLGVTLACAAVAPPGACPTNAAPAASPPPLYRSVCGGTSPQGWRAHSHVSA